MFHNFIGLLPHTFISLKPYTVYLRGEKITSKNSTFNISKTLDYAFFSKHFDVLFILEKCFAFKVIALIYSKPVPGLFNPSKRLHS